MAIITNTPVRPNQQNQTGDIQALAIERFTGTVEGTIARKSVLDGFVKREAIKGTTTLTNKGIGEVQLQVLVPGEAPDGTGADISKASVTVDTVVLARNILPLLETFQTDFNVQAELGNEHGKQHAKFGDSAFFIAAAKTAELAQSAYSNGAAGKPAGHSGGSRITLALAGDAQDPAKVYDSIKNLFIQMENKDVDPRQDDVMLAVRPEQFYTLQGAEQIVNGNYVTANGTKLDNIPIFKAFGVPVISSNNVPNTNIVGHRLSTARNGNFYDGDFSKLLAVAFSPRALMAGETIPLTSKVWFNDLDKQWYVDSYTAFAVGSNRAEYAGAIWLP